MKSNRTTCLLTLSLSQSLANALLRSSSLYCCAGSSSRKVVIADGDGGGEAATPVYWPSIDCSSSANVLMIGHRSSMTTKSLRAEPASVGVDVADMASVYNDDVFVVDTIEIMSWSC